ncbi:hypothetical protein ES703_63696 [subsurface metagenome]
MEHILRNLLSLVLAILGKVLNYSGLEVHHESITFIYFFGNIRADN